MKPLLKTTSKMNTRIQGLMAIGAISCGVSAVQAASQTPAGASTTPTEHAAAPSDADALAKKLANPIAAMISIPFQHNFDWGSGPGGDGFQWKMNFQPVIPFKLSEDWNLVTRTILPVISQNDVGGTKANPSGSQSGLSDTSMSLWFSPTKPTNGWVWGVGPAFLIPTGTDDLLTAKQWGAGATAILLKQEGHHTYGALADHIWSLGGHDGYPTVNNTFVEPFYSYTPGGGWTYTIQSETSYNWQNSEWTVPLNLEISKLMKIGSVPLQIQGGVRYYAEKPKNGPDWGLRLNFTFLIPEN
jgi:hypothetical protein